VHCIQGHGVLYKDMVYYGCDIRALHTVKSTLSPFWNSGRVFECGNRRRVLYRPRSLGFLLLLQCLHHNVCHGRDAQPIRLKSRHKCTELLQHWLILNESGNVHKVSVILAQHTFNSEVSKSVWRAMNTGCSC